MCHVVKIPKETHLREIETVAASDLSSTKLSDIIEDIDENNAPLSSAESSAFESRNELESEGFKLPPFGLSTNGSDELPPK